jgi:putative transcriptional regulator
MMTIEKRKKFNRIKLVLVEKEKSSQWLATELGLSATAVSKWCTNRNQPTVQTLFKIAELLQVEVSQLLVTSTDDQSF